MAKSYTCTIAQSTLGPYVRWICDNNPSQLIARSIFYKFVAFCFASFSFDSLSVLLESHLPFLCSCHTVVFALSLISYSFGEWLVFIYCLFNARNKQKSCTFTQVKSKFVVCVLFRFVKSRWFFLGFYCFNDIFFVLARFFFLRRDRIGNICTWKSCERVLQVWLNDLSNSSVFLCVVSKIIRLKSALLKSLLIKRILILICIDERIEHKHRERKN